MLRQVDNLSDLLTILPKLVASQHLLDGLWESDLEKAQFASRILAVYQDESAFFCEEHGAGFKYCIVLHKFKNAHWYCWLFYVNVEHRELTKSIMAELKTFCESRNIKDLRFATTRTTRSYERWITKFGATKQAIVYQMEI